MSFSETTSNVCIHMYYTCMVYIYMLSNVIVDDLVS